MSGTDPDSRRNKPIDRTQAWRPADAAPTPPADPNLPKIPGITLHFELARGGMGVVYSGRQDFLDRRVAVKLLSVELGGESFVQRFQREAKILAGIKHANIVACHMAGQTDEGQSYLVMEFIDGPSLKKWITDNGPVPVKAALRTARAVGQALGHAHTLGIIHRDVKPENILLETVTSTALDVTFPFTPKVVDLGLARASEGNAALGLTSPGSVMGTPATMSPEQYDEPDSVDFRTDIYGLGCALYEMLTGKPAFRGKKLSEILARKREPLAPDPCSENKDVPSAVGALVQSMLAPERESRPASYKELDEMLAALVDVLSSSSSRVTKPQAFVGEETITGSFRPTRPGGDIGENPTIVQGGGKKPVTKAKHDAELDGDRTVPAKPKPKDQQGAEKKPDKQPQERSGPGLLHTGEINFLAEGLGAPMGENGGESPFRTKPPADGDGGRGGAPGPDVWATKAPTGGRTQVTDAAESAGGKAATPMPAARSKAGIYAAVAAIVVLAGVVGWFVFGGGSGPKGDPKTDPVVVTDPNPDRPKPPEPQPKPKPSNKMPTLSLSGPAEIAPRRSIKIIAEAKDEDGAIEKAKYKWSFPLDLFARSATDANSILLELADGLPGVKFEIACRVTDEAGAEETKVHEVKVADYAAEQPWIGLRYKPSEWSLDGGSAIAWNDVQLKGYVSCTAKQESRWAQTSQGDEAYWEWFGSLESQEDANTPFATLGLRLELGDAGWAVVANRSDNGSDYTIQVMRAKRTGDTWKLEPVDQPKKQWPAAAENDDPLLAAFSMRRVGNQLFFRYGRALVPESGAPTEQEMSEFVVPMPADVPEQKITFFVDKGIGRFHVKRR